MEVLLSIIVPIYNSESSIAVMLDSICKSKCTDIEIILVDDGSTDNSLAVCNDYSEKDNRITVIHKENRGVSSARNCGIEVAQGDYIAFFDSDDSVVFQTMDRMLEILSEENVDMITADIAYLDIKTNQVNVPSVELPSNRIIDKTEIISRLISPLVLSFGTGLASSCNKFFRRSIITENNLRFEENVYKGEDWRFILDFLSIAETAYYIPEVLYEYRLDGSQTEQKYRTAIGICTLGSLKRKLCLNKRFILGAAQDQILIWYSEVIEQILISIKNNCIKTELKDMIKDPFSQEASKAILNASGEQLLQLEIPRRYKLYSKLICLKWYHTLFTLIRRLEK